MITINNMTELEQYNDNYIFGGKQYTIPDSCMINFDLLDGEVCLFVSGNLHSDNNIYVQQIAAKNIMTTKKLIAKDVITADGCIFAKAKARRIRARNMRKVS